ncbi:uncharacterized protein [Typha angustifolia]|uniref:uncharacterized protein n=1 Tax=Typha angustifolia TaxID=59011 RepID=UPI003C30551B
MYSPTTFRRHITFPAFSYVTTILTIGDATIADALHGAASAFYGTILGVLPALLTLFLMQPYGVFSIATTTLVVALTSFAVATIDSAGLITKRVALGQIVIIYVANFKQDNPTHAKAMLMHPAHVAASTAIGVLASILATMLPYPSFACCEVREKSKLYTEMATERIRLLVDAFCSDNYSCMTAFISRARCFGSASTKLLQDIKLKQSKSQWEKPPFKLSPPHAHNRMPSDRLMQDFEMALRGMEIALTSTTLFPIKFLDQNLKTNLLSLRDQLILKLLNQNLLTEAKEIRDESLRSLNFISKDSKDLAPLFFLFSINLLCNDPELVNAAQEMKVMSTTNQAAESCGEVKNREAKTTCLLNSLNLTSTKFIVALKCSLSLGLSVLLGLLFSKANGYWSGLTVAITMTPWRESTFKLANVRAQGTALGSVYGVLGSLISQNLMELRFLVLLPWIIFAGFLRHSRMYGPAGGIAAAISAVIILGRKNYGEPSVFTIARLTEAFIGLLCSILVELLLQPTRASTMARTQLYQSIGALGECMEYSLVSSWDLGVLKEKEKELREQVNNLSKYTSEAEAEPNFWFLPLNIACYRKLHGSLAKMMELLYFMGHSPSFGVPWNELKEGIDGDLEHFKKLVGCSLNHSLTSLEKGLDDLEIGRQQEICGCGVWSAHEEEEGEKVMASFVHHAMEVAEKLQVDIDGEQKCKVFLYLASVGFCIKSLITETREIEKGILELSAT